MAYWFPGYPNVVIVDSAAERDTKWQEGTICYVRGTNRLYALDSGSWVLINKNYGVSATAPSSPIEGDTYINSGDNTYYIYYGGTWQSIATLTPVALEFLLMETGETLLQENGDKIALE